MTLEEFQPWHLDEMQVQESQTYLQPFLPELLEHYRDGDAWTVRRGRVLACGGIINTEVGGHLWGVVSRGAPLTVLHKIVARALSTYQMPITATVETDFLPGCRWLKLLGFKQHGVEPKYGPDGRDHYVFVRQS